MHDDCKNSCMLGGVRRRLIGLVAGVVTLSALGASPAMAEVKQYEFRYGPVKVGPYQVVQKDLTFNIPKPDVDGHVTAMDVDVVDADGTQVPISRLMLHHIVFANFGKQDRTCNTITGWDSRTALPAMAERFYAAGEERAKLAMPQGYGYPVKAADQWLMTYMVMNHRNRTDTAYIEYNVTVDTDPSLKPVEPYWLDVENCKFDPVYDVPGGKRRGSTDSETTTWTVPKAGRIVAAGGHVHGGGKDLTLRRQGCPGGGEIYSSRPVWGSRNHPFYNVRPILHEPGPIHMSGFTSAQGAPVAAGEKVVLESNYDAALPHTRVMGIMLAYLAPDDSVTSRCQPNPGDYQELPAPRGRTKPPAFEVPIVGIRRGRAVNIAAPRGRRRALGNGGTVRVGDMFFRQPNIQVRSGATVNWRFKGQTLHNVTVANGPRGFSSPNLNGGRGFTKRLTVPGTYKLFCGLHPVDMTATVKVTRKRR
jgi:plastocyanin